MDLLSYPKGEYLVDASLDSLHAESLSWLKELEFLEEETSFLVRLLAKKGMKTAFPSTEIAEFEKELVNIKSEKLDKLYEGILSHERLLSSALKTASLPEETIYREAHRILQDEMRNIIDATHLFKEKCFFLN